MSPSPGDAPRTPDRKSSSSSILDAFRILTSGRPKSTSQAAVHPPALTPIQSFFSRSEVKKVDDVERKLSGNGSSSTGHTCETEDSTGAQAMLTNMVEGGTPELAKLLSQLDKTHTVQERVAAAQRVSTILDAYRVNNSLAIWASAQDLLVHESSDVSRAAHTLLVSCIKSSELSSFERTSYFEAIQPLSDDRHIDLRIKALVEITSNGRNVESLELLLAPYLVRLLQTNFVVVTRTRRKEKNPKSDTTIAEEQSFADLFQFIVDVTKFNAKAFEEHNLNLLLDEVISICKRTTHEADIISSINVINALMTYTRVSVTSIQPCVELLGDIFRQLSTLKKTTWAALSNILRSHLGPQLVQHLLKILENANTPNAAPNNTIRGALFTLAHLYRKNGKEGLPEVSLMQLLPDIRTVLLSRDRKLAVDVIILFGAMLDGEVLFEKLKEQLEWDDFVEAIIACVRILPMIAASTNNVPYEKARETPPAKGQREVDIPGATQAFGLVISKLSSAFPELDLIHKESVASLFLQLGFQLRDDAAEVLITHCAEDRLVYPSNTKWLDNCRELVKTYLHDNSRSNHLRVLVANILKEVYTAVEALSESSATDFALLALEKMSAEEDPNVLEALSGFAVTVVADAPDRLFDEILSIVRTTIFQRRPSIPVSQNLSPTLSALTAGISPQVQPSLCRIAAKHAVRMFIASINKSPTKAEKLFNFVLDIAGSNDLVSDARICAVKLLFRLRATSDYAIYIRPLSESESVAAVLCRTAETAQWIQADDSSSRDARNVSSGNMQSKQKHLNVKRPVPPLWFYPGPKGLPEEPAREPSPCLFSYVDPVAEPVGDPLSTLKMNQWLEKIIELLQTPETDWEIYSYIVVHTGAQLSNQSLFKGAIPQVKFLRSVLCDQIKQQKLRDPPDYTCLKKADVAVCIFHMLTILVSYHTHFAKSEEDDLVRAFLLGIGTWERTSKWCIHALTVCCHEMPLSVSKSLDNLITKMATVITQSQIAIHILEFLVMLARLPELYKNFREDEYKMVFGVSFRYLQYVRDQQEKDSSQLQPRPGRAAMRHSDSFRELKMLSDTDVRSNPRSPTDDLPQYVYALAFHVITFWFMNLRLQDRPLYMTWIAKNLTYQDKFGKEVIEDQGLVTMDMMDKIAYSDRDETAPDPHFAKDTDGEVSQRTWVVGLSLLTIATAGRTGLSQLTKRRPSGTKYSTYRPSLTSPPRHQVPLTTGLAADAFYTNSYIGVLPEDVLQEYYSSLSLATSRAERPIPLPDEDAVRRAISSFDLNSTVDGHKVGVIYIGPDQTQEADMLANTYGSAEYTSFIGELGFLTRLNTAKFNAQGLDRSNDSDGKYTYCWRDRATEIVFHITTMMPTDKANDPQCTKKKSHIGNDFVNVVWNDSGHPFRFDTFPSAFNYVYIVVTPETTQSFASARSKENFQPNFYKVHVLSAPGFPEISPAAEPKVVSAKALPAFVRLVALNASVFSLVWAHREGGEHFSPWRNRLREIKRLREKYGGIRSGRGGSSTNFPSPLSGGAGHGAPPPSTTERSASTAVQTLNSHSVSRERGVSGLANRASLATFHSDNMSRSSLTPSSTSTDHGE